MLNTDNYDDGNLFSMMAPTIPKFMRRQNNPFYDPMQQNSNFITGPVVDMSMMGQQSPFMQTGY